MSSLKSHAMCNCACTVALLLSMNKACQWIIIALIINILVRGYFGLNDIIFHNSLNYIYLFLDEIDLPFKHDGFEIILILQSVFTMDWISLDCIAFFVWKGLSFKRNRFQIKDFFLKLLLLVFLTGIFGDVIMYWIIHLTVDHMGRGWSSAAALLSKTA